MSINLDVVDLLTKRGIDEYIIDRTKNRLKENKTI